MNQSSLLYSATVTTDDSMSHKQTNTDIFDSGSDIENVAFMGVTIYFSVSSLLSFSVSVKITNFLFFKFSVVKMCD